MREPEPAPDLFQEAQYEEQEPEQFLDNEVPPPAYRPAPMQPQRAAAQQQPPLSLDNDPGGFVAPRPRAAGTPSPEALARLQAAVSKSPAPAQAARPAAPQPQQRPAAQAPKPADKPRFGIGSLINRMAGGHAEQAPERTQASRQQPTMSGYDDEQELSADQERIEIPAFLRRQAN
jgi:cell division protein FtsZ